ncbi:PREDICTED: uncharacterized protein LOC106809360 [Priapulus caudatus]|uniref:Uncharacterized protein LOC106809360 n=1 Tax=Priapulus caudatus TaxID=37621 RepID=A0ABM1E6U0_PRICU|nr:PREDICTED: uncharacterized protein LOC106809360 [Priapulus caudatus]
MDMLQFWNRRHPKYFTIAHHFLACVGGYAPPQIRHHLMWNRVANLNGKPGGNIGLDLCNEHINRDFKELLANSNGNYTPQTVKRCSQMSGPYGRTLDDGFTDVGLVDMRTPNRKRRPNLYKADVSRFVTEYSSDSLCDYIPGREHDAFPNFEAPNQLFSPVRLGRKLYKFSHAMDSWRQIKNV